MCNPRRIRISATRRINEAWQREVARVCELSTIVAGEARVRDAIASTVGRPALIALEQALANGCEGWTAFEDGYRFDVEGGFAYYSIDTQELEIVAILQDEVCVAGEHRETLKGEVDTDVTVQGEGQYFSDGWGGRTKERAQREAKEDAERKLARAVEQSRREAADKAEQESIQAIAAQARQFAEEKLEAISRRRQAELADQARLRLEMVGIRARQAFNRVLAQAYRDAILAYARANGAGGIRCNEDGNVVELEFSINV